MPSKYYRKKTSRTRKTYGNRKFYKRRRSYGRGRFRKLLSGSKAYGTKTYWRAKLVPRVMCIKMPYHTWATLTSSLTPSHSTVSYRGNSPYDPEVATGGYQPPNWDDIANLYYEYICVGCKITVNFINKSTSYVNVFIKAEQGDGTTFNPTTNEPFDQEDIRVKTLSPQTSGARNSVTLSMYRSARTIFGKNPLNTSELAAVVSTNPSTRWSYIVGAFDRSLTDIPVDVDIEVQLKYYVVFRKRVNNLSQDA